MRTPSDQCRESDPPNSSRQVSLSVVSIVSQTVQDRPLATAGLHTILVYASRVVASHLCPGLVCSIFPRRVYLHSSSCLSRFYLPLYCLMASSDGKSIDGGDDILESPTSDSFQPSATPIHIYPFSSSSQTVRSKRTQVKNACTKCQKACKKCDPARPCLRCIKYGVPEDCRDAERKGRQKGAKRGPYKKRDGRGSSIAQSKDPSQEIELHTSSPPSGSSPPAAAFTGSIPVGYTPGFYAQFPLPPGHKPGDSVYYPPFYVAPGPSSPHAGHEGEGSAYPPPPQFFPATFMTAYAQPYPAHMAYTRPDGHIHYPGAPPAVKPPAPVGADERDDQSGYSPEN
ncbi:hypothetical protein MVEN_02080900 [Mycena venus]|uniref:Zn(2)-C6 fungal-type domain-containing protein n=1 Tax=Mycena venus TaxID=2733690 RepID=A0A8H7CJS0_9AGAR|nr:hypothetical protein MVEN_02080900 [Mycena venus]